MVCEQFRKRLDSHKQRYVAYRDKLHNEAYLFQGETSRKREGEREREREREGEGGRGRDRDSDCNRGCLESLYIDTTRPQVKFKGRPGGVVGLTRARGSLNHPNVEGGAVLCHCQCAAFQRIFEQQRVFSLNGVAYVDAALCGGSAVKL